MRRFASLGLAAIGCAFALAFAPARLYAAADAAKAEPAAAAAAAADASADPTALLKQADDLKTADNPGFLRLLEKLEARAGEFSPYQRAFLHYLKSWQFGYTGHYDEAVPGLESVIAETDDPTLKFRAQISLVNDQVLASHYLEAYSGLSQLLEQQPRVQDHAARSLGYAVAALLYNQAGQYDLGLSYAQRWLDDDADGTAPCKAGYLRIDAIFRAGRLRIDDPRIASAIEACDRIHEPLYANAIRTSIANIDIAGGRVDDAIALIRAHDDEMQRSHSARLSSEFHSILARAYLLKGDLAAARRYAASAVDKSIQNEYSKPLVDAYAVLYEVAKREDNLTDALAYHEKYAAADKGWINDTTARTLAFQMVNQQVLDKKREIDALNERNQVLQLQQRIAEKSAEAERLYLVLLAIALAAIVYWAWRTKQSQLLFKRLARRDGLTGIFNREHFLDESRAIVQYCARSRREACLILIDLDHFKNVNDTHGHSAGDRVLKRTVAICQLFMRSMDTFGRLGGEEFGVLLPDCSLEVALGRAEELRSAISGFVAGEQDRDDDVSVSASFGVTSTRHSGYDLREMLIHADSALYRAKRNGRDRVEAYERAFAEDAATA